MITDETNTPVFHYSYKEVINTFEKYAVKNETPPGRTMANVCREDPRWMGATKAEIMERIENGYEFDKMPETMLPDAGEGEGARWYFTDDPDGAEYQYDLDEGGEMDYYLKRKPVIGHPGIKIRMGFCFSASTNSETISEYGQWVGALCQTLMDNEYDIELDLFWHTTLLGGRRNAKVEIEVSKFGEEFFFQDFAVWFSPGGYRNLMHVAASKPEEEGHIVERSLGTPQSEHSRYGLDWDDETRTLTVSNDRTTSFDKDRMNHELINIIGEIDS